MSGMATTQVDYAGQPPRPEQDAPAPRERLLLWLPPRSVSGWLGPILVALFAAVLRFFRLGEPHALAFDETFYAQDALSLAKYGVEHEAVKNSSRQLLAGNETLFTDAGAFVVHPPLGKWVIALGEAVFGATPFGWRFSAAVVGSLSVLILARVARRMTRSTLLGCTAGLLLALDGLHFVHSRVALLDVFMTFWILAAFACLVADRDSARVRFAERFDPDWAALGPGLAFRWWRLLAGVCLGLAIATKWSAVFYILAFGVLTFAWDMGARRSGGARHPIMGTLVRDALPAFGSIVVVAGAVYVMSWAGWFLTDTGWDRNLSPEEAATWASAIPGGAALAPHLPTVLNSWMHYHQEILNFHLNLSETHPYQSKPWTWPLLSRPVAYYWESFQCDTGECARAVLGVGTPAIWWAAMPATLAMLVWWIRTRDWRAGAILVGVAAGWLPWLAVSRTAFLFYMLPAVPFMVLGITICLGLVLGRADAHPFRRGLGAALAGAYVLLVVVNFWYLYPVLSADVIPYQAWQARMWFESWI